MPATARRPGTAMAHERAAAATAAGDAAGWVQPERRGDRLVIRVGGRWDIDTAAALDRELAALPQVDGAAAELDLSGLDALDTAGAWLLRRTRDALAARGITVSLTHADPGFAALLEQVEKVDATPAPVERPPGKLVEIAARVGEATIDAGREGWRLLGFYGMLVVKLWGVILRPRRLRLTAIVYHMEQTGLNAVPIIALLSFLIGVVLAFQGAAQLQRFGAELLVVNLLGISILRELGVLLTAIIIAGRSGSAFTAEIGTMKINQEIDAIETLGLDPFEVLILPRVLALFVTLPLLGFFGSIMGLFGGAVMSYFILDITFGQFIKQLQTAVSLNQLWIGLVKAPVFAFTIAMVGCYEGLKVTGSAESVGRLTTQSVVVSIFLVIIIDAVFSIMFANVGI